MERDSFVLLLHAYTVSGGLADVELSDLALGRDLAFDLAYLQLLLDHLAAGGFVRCRPGGAVFIAPRGAEYIRELARQRRSVRYAVAQRGAPGISKWPGGWRGIRDV
jgi:hypothetical protein